MSFWSESLRGLYADWQRLILLLEALEVKFKFITATIYILVRCFDAVVCISPGCGVKAYYGWLGCWYVCVLHRGLNSLLLQAMDGRIMRHGIISSCQSAATCEIVKRCWSGVYSCKQHYSKYPDLYVWLCHWQLRVEKTSTEVRGDLPTQCSGVWLHPRWTDLLTW